MMIRLCQEDDEQFVVHNGKVESLVTHVSGSPLSGSTWLKLFSLRTAKTLETPTRGLGARAKRLAEVVKSTNKPLTARPSVSWILCRYSRTRKNNK